MSEWLPIESAPKDGTRILVTRSGATGKPPINIVWMHENSPKRRGWRKGLNKLLRYQPTHWMPLPAPPSDRIDAQAGGMK